MSLCASLFSLYMYGVISLLGEQFFKSQHVTLLYCNY